MKSPRTLQVNLTPWTTMTAEQTRGELVTFDVGPDGQAYLVFAQNPTDYRDEKSHGSFAKTKGKESQTYRVLAIGDTGCSLDVSIIGEPYNIHHVQPLRDDLLLACARCRYRGVDDVDLNGRVYSRDGRFLREMLLGDGIQSLQTTLQGDIWTSYFDEGVFGNYGWNEPVGSSGLIAWDSGGVKQYEFEPEAPLDSICDCYALNVETERDVWFYYYTEFPLVHLRDRTIHGVWQMPIAGSHVLAIGRGHVLMDGGYDDRRVFSLCELRNSGQVTRVASFKFTGVGGESLGAENVYGRGTSLFFQRGLRIYRFKIEDALSSLQKS